MPEKLSQIKQDFTEGLSQISRFWGFPKGMGAIFAVLYLSPVPLSLDEIVQETGLTKGAISTEVRTLARMGLVHRSSRLADRRDYYEAEEDFYKSIRSILKERQNSEFDRAIGTVRTVLDKLEAGSGSDCNRAAYRRCIFYCDEEGQGALQTQQGEYRHAQPDHQRKYHGCCPDTGS